MNAQPKGMIQSQFEEWWRKQLQQTASANDLAEQNGNQRPFTIKPVRQAKRQH